MKAVIFDCFGVLYADPSQVFYEKNVANYEELRPRLLELNAQSDRGMISRQQWTEQVAELAKLDVELVRSRIMSENARNQPLIDYTQQLRGGGYLIGMLSNVGAGGMERFFSAAEREQLFDAVVLSGEVGVAKPSPVIFKMIAERLSVGPGDCVMVDDNEDNCAGADAAGMRAVHYQSNTQVRRDLEAILG